MATQTYITYFYPGSFFAEESTSKVANRDIPKDIPKSAFAFSFHDREEIQSGGETLKGEKKNHSKRFYINGKVFTLAELKAAYPSNTSLIRNIENAGGDAILCRSGNWQVFDKGDQNITIP
jgi:hypothetical protein